MKAINEGSTLRHSAYWLGLFYYIGLLRGKRYCSVHFGVYWMINFVIAALIVMGAINTGIRFAENTHKYGPIALKKVVPVGSFVVSNPFALTTIVMIGMMTIAVALSHLAGPPDPSFIVGPDGTIVLDPFLFPII